MKKKIGIVGWSLGENSFGVSKPYLEYFSRFGQVEILTPRKDMVEGLDLLVLPGGKDANPFSYDQVPGFNTGDADVFKEYFFKQNLPQYIEAKTPIFGICLGFQYLNIFFEGKLTQDLVTHPYYSNPRGEEVHEVVKITGKNNEGQWLISKTNSFKVNSLHHQGVYLHQLGKGLVPTLICKKDELVEAFVHETLPISACQYHPEELWDTYSYKEIKRLLNGTQI